jgi:hypothetical protein
MANKHLKLEPHNINKDVWWYETHKGVETYSYTHGYLDTIRIPWKDIRAALKRKDKK